MSAVQALPADDQTHPIIRSVRDSLQGLRIAMDTLNGEIDKLNTVMSRAELSGSTEPPCVTLRLVRPGAAIVSDSLCEKCSRKSLCPFCGLKVR